MVRSEANLAADLARVEAMRTILDSMAMSGEDIAQSVRGLLMEMHNTLFSQVECVVENSKDWQG